MEAATAIDGRIQELGDWRGEALALIRNLIHEADPLIVEETKWATPSNMLGVPVWSHCGIVCTGEAYSDKVKITFMHGAQLPDPHGLFNGSLSGNMRRAIYLHREDRLDPAAFKELVRAAVAANLR